LSSCTNYDDQFDDLNTQINTLKSQIEGFSSLSSGLTALQGTVASLQTAIANIPVTPATDISGLESTQAALQTALTALATEVTALQTSLAAADTSADVDALTLALDKVKTDLAELLASNNVYTPANNSPLSITTAAELAFAKSLGNKVGIINGALTVTQSASMDATDLAAVLAKVKSVTGAIIFTAKATGITQTAGFTSLTSAGSLDIDVDGPVSLPVLASTTTLEVNDNTKLTSFSAPKLETVTHFNNGTSNGALTLTKATSVNLASLIRYNAALTITQKSGLVDLSALANTNETTGSLDTAYDLTLTGATSFSLPVRTAGKIVANQVTAAVSLPVWKGADDSSFDRASEVVLPSITGLVAIKLNEWAPKATKFHYIGTGLKASSTVTNYPTFTTGASNSNLETLIIDGTSTSVNISDAIDLTSLTFTGAANTVTLNDLESMTEITLGYVSKIGSYSSGTLAVTSNEKLESLTADSLDDISSLDISGNENLATISFDALNSLGTSSAGAAITAANINITGNDFTASNIQLPSDSTDAVAVTAAITTTSGLNDLEVYAGLAAAKSTTEVFVIDHVEKVTLKDGTTPASVAAITSSTSASKGFAWAGADQSVTLMFAGTASSGSRVDARYQTATAGLNTAIFTNSDSNTTALGTSDVINIHPRARGTNLATLTTDNAFTNTISGFDANNPSTFAGAIATELNRQLDAGGHPYEVSIVNDFGENYVYNAEATINTTGVATTVSSTLLASNQILFKYNGTNLTAPVTVSGDAGVEAGVVHAINNGSLSKTFRAEIASAKVKVTPLTNAGADDNSFANSSSAPALEWYGYNATTSKVYALAVSQVINTTAAQLNKGWRITVKNESLTVRANELDAGLGHFVGGTLSGTLSNIAVSVVGTALSNTDVLVEWGDITAGSIGTFVAGTAGYNLVSWF